MRFGITFHEISSLTPASGEGMEFNTSESRISHGNVRLNVVNRKMEE